MKSNWRLRTIQRKAVQSLNLVTDCHKILFSADLLTTQPILPHNTLLATARLSETDGHAQLAVF